ncbi:MAG: M48 family metallopeptidase [Flavobacteriales bacterium]
MPEQTIHIDGIPVTLFESKKAKNLNITIKPFTGVRVSVPKGTSFRKAEDLVSGRIASVKKHLQRMKEAESGMTIFDWNSRFKTRSHELNLVQGKSDKIRSVVRDGMIRVAIPEGLEVTSGEVQTQIRRGIERAWRKEAQEVLPGRVNVLASENGFEFKRVTIQNARTRWGSCSQDNNINLSLHLMRLSDHLVDYVILHELVHTRIKNHSREFWQLLEQVCEGGRKKNSELKIHSIQIY